MAKKLVKMSDRLRRDSREGKAVKEMFHRFGLEAVRLNAHRIGISEQMAIRLCIFYLENEGPLRCPAMELTDEKFRWSDLWVCIRGTDYLRPPTCCVDRFYLVYITVQFHLIGDEL